MKTSLKEKFTAFIESPAPYILGFGAFCVVAGVLTSKYYEANTAAYVEFLNEQNGLMGKALDETIVHVSEALKVIAE